MADYRCTRCKQVVKKIVERNPVLGRYQCACDFPLFPLVPVKDKTDAPD